MTTPIRLLAGLGNPGKKYERDRHNVGFWAIDALAAKAGVTLTKDARYHGLIGKMPASQNAAGNEVWLVQPQTFMNESGRCVGALARFFKIPAEQILVIHDELDFAPGVVKLKKGGGVAGHNGLKDISAVLGTQDFWRLRIGIGHPGDRSLVADYVLSSPSPDDRIAIDLNIDKVLDCMPLMLSGDMTAAMLKLHTKG